MNLSNNDKNLMIKTKFYSKTLNGKTYVKPTLLILKTCMKNYQINKNITEKICKILELSESLPLAKSSQPNKKDIFQQTTPHQKGTHLKQATSYRNNCHMYQATTKIANLMNNQIIQLIVHQKHSIKARSCSMEQKKNANLPILLCLITQMALNLQVGREKLQFQKLLFQLKFLKPP